MPPRRRPRPAVLAALLLALSALLHLTGCAAPIPPGRSAVDSVAVHDARALAAADIEDKLSTAPAPKFLGLFHLVYDDEIFDPAALQRDVARVERYYRGKGFLEARVRTARVVPASADRVRIELVVEEGLPTTVHGMFVTGLQGVPPAVREAATLAVGAALPRGSRFDEDAFAAAKVAVKRALTDRGYAYAQVDARVEIDVLGHAADFSFTATPGPATVYGPITFTGLDPKATGGVTIDEPPLRKALRLREGEAYSTSALESATQALLDLEVLSAVQIVPTLSDPPAPVVPLTVKVQPTKLRALRLGGGFELDEIKTEVHALVGWEDHDFLGDLRDFSVDFKPGAVLYPMRLDHLVAPQNILPQERLRLQLRQPGFIESRSTLYVRPELNVYPLLVTPDPDPAQPVVGYVEPRAAVGVDRRFGKHFIGDVSYNLQGEYPFPYLPQLPITEPLPQILLSYPQLITTLDLRDDPVHPHSGAFFSNNLQVAGLGGSATDVRVQPEARAYVPLTRRVTLATRGTIGMLFAHDYGDYVQRHLKEPIVPLPVGDTSHRTYADVDRDIEVTYFRGFFSGGPSANRGFPLRGIAPHGPVPFLNPALARSQVASACVPGSASYDAARCSVPIGGFTLWEASVEARFTVSGAFGAAVFCDAGDVSASTADVRLAHIHLACGAGGRYDTPVGPIRLDLGYRVPFLQVLGYASEDDVAAHDPTEGYQPKIFGVPLAVSFGIGEAF